MTTTAPCRLATLCCLGLLASSLAAAQTTPVGTATYVADVDLDLLPGGGAQNIRYRAIDKAWKRDIPEGTARGRIYPQFPLLPPSEAQATATDASLKALAVASGVTQSNPGGPTPGFEAHATASNTRYYETGAVDTPLTVTPFLDGMLSAQLQYAELPQSIFTHVSFRLDIVDLSGTPLNAIFALDARIDWLGGALGMRLSTNAFGASVAGGNWTSSVTDVTLPYQGAGRLDAQVLYTELLESVYTAPAASLFGVRWTLETDSLLRGTSMAGAMASDFGHTALLDLRVADGALPGAGLTEVLVAAPVPEPSAGALLALGLAAGALLWRRRF